MNELLVLYDSLCPFCVRCREWLESSVQVVPLRFLCCRSSVARQRYGEIDGLGTELIVVDASGRYWVGPEAFLVCLWALDVGHGLSDVLHWPVVWPFARTFFGILTAQRSTFGALVGAPCHGEQCGAGHPGAMAPSSPYR